MKKRIGLVLILFSVVLLVGCSNPQGGFGPSWDVGFKVPLTRGYRTEITDIISGEDLDLSGEVISFSGGEELETIDIGSYITDIDLPDTSGNPVEQQISLPEITLDNLINTAAVIPNISGGMNEPGPYDSDPVDLTTDFSSLTFSSRTLDDGGSPLNELNISVTAPTGVTVDGMDVELFTDNGSGVEVSLGTVNVSSTSSGMIDLSNLSITSYIRARVTNIQTSGTGGPGDMNINLSIPKAELTIISGFSFSSPQVVDLGQITVDLGISDFTLNSISFASGTIDLAITEPSGSNLEINFDDINIGGLTDNSGGSSININLSGQTLNLNGTVTADLAVSVSGTNITYDTNQTATFTAGFTNPVVDAISAVFDNLTSSNILPADFNNPVIDLPDIEQDIRDIIDKITLNNLNVNLVINNNTGIDADPGELVADLGTIEFIARNSDGNPIPNGSFTLGDIDPDAAYIGKGENALALINTSAPTDFLDILKKFPASVEVLVKSDGSSGGFTIGSGGQPVTINTGSTFDLSLDYSLGLDMTLNENVEEIYYERESFDGFTTDELVDKVFDSARLVIEDFDNQLPVELEVYFYIADIDNHSTLNDIEFEKALFQETNKLEASLVIDAKTAQPVDKEIILVDQSILNKFTGDNLFFGVKYVLPAGDYRFETDDYISIGNIYGSFVFKVNQ